MAFSKTLYYGDGEYSAADDRLFHSFDRTEGVLDFGSLAVSQRAAGANWSVDISSGWAFLKGDEQTNQGTYVIFNDAVYNKPLSTFAPTTNPRVDTVVLRFYDSEVDSNRTPLNVPFIDIIPGTPTAGASTSNIVGTAAVPPTAMVLGYLVIPVGATSVLSSYIVDARAVSRSKVLPEDGSITSDMLAPGAVEEAATTGFIPPGIIADYGGTTAPTGWLLCNGAAYARTGTYAALFAIIGTTYGAGDGSTTFNVPDARGRVLAGKAAAGTFGALGAVPGVEAAFITVNELPWHHHSVSASGSWSGSISGSAASHDHKIQKASGGDMGAVSVPSGAIQGGSTGATGNYIGQGNQTFAGNVSASGALAVSGSCSVGGSVSGYATGIYNVNGDGSTNAGSPQGVITQLSRVQPTLVVNKIIKY